MPKKQPVTIPQDIQDVFSAYGFQESMKLENVVATRTDEEWFAILFPSDDEEDGPFFAVDFRHMLNFNSGEWYWEVQNDYVGPFDSIDEFLNDPLTKSFI